MNCTLSHTALLSLFLLCSQLSCLAETSPPKDTTSSFPGQTTDATKRAWVLPHISTYTQDLYDFDKYCPDTRNDTVIERPNFKGQKVKCTKEKIGSKDYDDALTEPKREMLINTILPNFIATFAPNTPSRRLQTIWKVPIFDADSVCAHFNVPEEHRTNGVQGTDILVYVAAGPMTQNEKDTPVWAELCPMKDNQPIWVAVMNFNPRKLIVDKNTARYAVEELNKAIQRALFQHKERFAIYANEKTGDREKRGERNCVNESSPVNHIPEAHFSKIDDGKDHSLRKAFIPAVNIIGAEMAERVVRRNCRKRERKLQVTSLSKSLKPLRIKPSYLTLYDSNKYCPQTNHRLLFFSDIFREYMVPCVSTTVDSTSDYLTEEKRAKIKSTVENMIKKFDNLPKMYSSVKSLEVPLLDNDPLCSEFQVDPAHRFHGFNDSDIVLLVASGPLPIKKKTSVPAWAVPCVHFRYNLATAAMNINPIMILNHSTMEDDIFKELLNALKLSECQSSKSNLMLRGTSGHRVYNIFCVSVRCMTDGFVQVRYTETESWRLCPEGQSLSSSDASKLVYCPKYSEVCTTTSSAQGTSINNTRGARIVQISDPKLKDGSEDEVVDEVCEELPQTNTKTFSLTQTVTPSVTQTQTNTFTSSKFATLSAPKNKPLLQSTEIKCDVHLKKENLTADDDDENDEVYESMYQGRRNYNKGKPGHSSRRMSKGKSDGACVRKWSTFSISLCIIFTLINILHWT